MTFVGECTGDFQYAVQPCDYNGIGISQPRCSSLNMLRTYAMKFDTAFSMIKLPASHALDRCINRAQLIAHLRIYDI